MIESPEGGFMSINVSRFIHRKKAEFSVEILTPMFLGGADGNAELRSPPFKNALRYWWRLTQGNLSSDDLLVREQDLFGGVKDNASRSRVDIVVTGNLTTDSVGARINIGSKKNSEAKGNNVSLAAYLGMGPIHFRGIYEKAPILPGQQFKFSVTYPILNGNEIEDALSLFAHLGSLGSRSRNGWGGLHMIPEEGTAPLIPLGTLYQKYGSEMSSIFNGTKQNKKYPFKLGYQSDGKDAGSAMMWKITDADNWKGAMQTAAEKYMDVRQVLKFPQNKAWGVQKRHILGYPVTNHKVNNWENNNTGRMPSQLRIVVRRQGDKFRSYFVHLPHKIPKTWDEKKLGSELSNWQELHSWLNENCVPLSL